MSLSKKYLKEILKQYDIKRTKNNQLFRKRLQEVYENIPEIRLIDNEISSKGLNISKQIINAPENKLKLINELKLELEALKDRKLKLLQENGYNKDYINPIYDCVKCKDTGYIGDKKCTCLKQEIINYAYKQSNLGNILETENFSSFSFKYYSNKKDEKLGVSPLEAIQSIHFQCKKFISEFESNFSNLILYGQAGLGKTFLCNCIAKELLDTGHTVIYLSSYQLFRIFETYRFNNGDEIISYDEIEDLFNCDLLIIDDLGSEVINSFTTAELFNCLNTRLLNKKSTVISTNLEPAALSKHYSNRIVSRIFGNYTLLNLIGDDIRLQKYR